MSDLETNKISLKIQIPYQVIGVLFGGVALLTLFSAISLLSTNFFIPTFLVSIAYAGLNGIMAYGFWRMKKWIVSLLGGTALIVAIINIINIFRGIQEINQAIIAFVILGVLFLFTFFSRKFLNGDYKNIKALGLSLVLIIFTQIIIIIFLSFK